MLPLYTDSFMNATFYSKADCHSSNNFAILIEYCQVQMAAAAGFSTQLSLGHNQLDYIG